MADNLADFFNAIALRRHPGGVQSGHVAVCLDVVSGMSVSDALRQNGPLPEADEKLHATDVDDALKHATPEHLAKLADALSARKDRAFKKALTGVAWAVAGNGPERLSSANIDSLTTLAGAFTKIHLDLKDRDLKTANEAVAMQVAVRGEDLLPQANIEQIATLAGAFCGYDDADVEDPSNFNDAMEALALQVTARGDDLLPQASAEQLATMRAAFSEHDELGYPLALAKVVKETAKRDEAGLSA
jgi:hypothetical protein